MIFHFSLPPSIPLAIILALSHFYLTLCIFSAIKLRKAIVFFSKTAFIHILFSIAHLQEIILKCFYLMSFLLNHLMVFIVLCIKSVFHNFSTNVLCFVENVMYTGVMRVTVAWVCPAWCGRHVLISSFCLVRMSFCYSSNWKHN